MLTSFIKHSIWAFPLFFTKKLSICFNLRQLYNSFNSTYFFIYSAFWGYKSTSHYYQSEVQWFKGVMTASWLVNLWRRWYLFIQWFIWLNFNQSHYTISDDDVKIHTAVFSCHLFCRYLHYLRVDYTSCVATCNNFFQIKLGSECLQVLCRW